ncbi:MAG: translational GTPase TypA [Oscillospiraceae bacterium]|jgi:GTP-binding protein|nr:translational GTPase TypA [Oscillospiraceae bacterium]
MKQEQIRNVAIIAHVDHGKTTLVDQMLRQAGVFRENQTVAERVMDSGDLERERGITIMAKNAAVRYGGCKINIVDTPGHADFGGEVERILKMVSGVLLLVDAAEGPMPQTRFVLERALALGHRVIIVINKVDRPDARVYEVCDEVLELLMDLDASAEQLDSPILFCSARRGHASLTPDDAGADLTPLFEKILSHIHPPEGDLNGPAQMLVSAVDYNDYVGRVGIGRIERGVLCAGQEITVVSHGGERPPRRAKVAALYVFDGLRREPAPSAAAGEIAAFAGAADITIGETVCCPSAPEALPFAEITQPTIEMTFCVNDSPFAGREGKYVTARHLRARLYRELLRDVSLRVSDTDTAEAFRVAGRGEMHLSILIETMRREGYEFQVSTPRVLFREVDGVLQEPMEQLVADLPDAAAGAVIEKLGARRGELLSMHPVGSRTRLTFLVPSRGLFGYRGEFLSDTRGEGIMHAIFHGYAPLKGEISRRVNGSLVAFESGEAVTYGLYNAQERGVLFIGSGVKVYAGMIVGQSARAEDMSVNVCKRKHLTNIRASGSDDALRLTPPRRLSLEQSLEFLADDELLEVTPQSLRLRKRLLSHELRMKAKKSANP